MGVVSKFKALIATVFEDVIAERQSIEVPHRADIRASSMPICWRDVQFGRWAEMAGRVPTKEWTLGSSLFTAIGTAIHASAQKYLGYAGLLWGSWECTTCGKVWLNQTLPGICCNELPEYIEYSLVHPDPSIGEFGHCDGLVPIPMIRVWFVIELKTTGESVASLRRLKGADSKHKKQVSAYHNMFKRGYAKIIKRGPSEPGFPKGRALWEADAVMPPGKQLPIALIMYVRRDKPKPQFWIPVPVRPIKNVMDVIERNAPKLSEAVQSGEVMKPRCTKFEDAKNPYNWKDVCPWAKKICFAPDPQDAAEHLFSLAQQGRKPSLSHEESSQTDFIPRKG